MVNRAAAKLDRVFHALSDATRRRILLQVAKSDCTVSELSRPLTISPPAISKHLKVLEMAGLLRRVRTDRFHRFTLETKPFTNAQGVLQNLTAAWQQRVRPQKDYLDHGP